MAQHLGIGTLLSKMQAAISDRANIIEGICEVLSKTAGVPIASQDIEFTRGGIRLRKLSPHIRTILALKRESVLQELKEKGFIVHELN